MNTDGKDFSFQSIQEFDTHIDLSIPNYKHLADLIRYVSSYFILPNTRVYDIGCSTGLMLRELSEKNNQKNVAFIGYDIAENLLNSYGPVKNVTLFNQDITEKSLKFPTASMIISMFTLQFLPICERKNVLERIYEGLLPGGALIISEKTYCNDGMMQDIFTFSYYDFKNKSFDEISIFGKQRALRTIMKPLSINENLSVLKEVGFTRIECLFQSLNFVAWVCVK